MDKTQMVAMINAIDIRVWAILVKMVCTVVLIMMIKDFGTHIYNWIALRFSQGFGVNTKLRYKDEIYYVDNIGLWHISLVNRKSNVKVLLPMNYFVSMPKEIILNGDKK